MDIFVCGNKIRTMIREDTELRNFPLYCPKCKKETIISAKDMKITLVNRK
ncbi:MAG TPA: cysteine-rich KTR domain-containing protein [Firmicutes bacterium]|nr:conjugal transfer protein [Bacillales bacterium]HJA40106.1 cysteine-rich KTR domain-containing protein [Bacillota bacterium]